MVGLLGILATTSAWVFIEKLVELCTIKFEPLAFFNLPSQEIWIVYLTLAVANVVLILIYEKCTRTNLFLKLGELV